MIPEILNRAIVPETRNDLNIARLIRHKFSFESLEPVAITDWTERIEDIVYRSRVDYGELELRSPHTTYGLFLAEITDPLKRDYINQSLRTIPEDYRSSWFKEKRMSWFVANGYIIPRRTRRFEHWCGENPLLPSEEKDDDFNAGRHLRKEATTSPYITIPIEDNQLLLGTFQRIGGWEHDGRDGLGSMGNPKRVRTLLARIRQFSDVVNLEDL